MIESHLIWYHTYRGFITGITARFFTAALASLTKAPAHVTDVTDVKFRAAFDSTPVRVPRSTYKTLPPINLYTNLFNLSISTIVMKYPQIFIYQSTFECTYSPIYPQYHLERSHTRQFVFSTICHISFLLVFSLYIINFSKVINANSFTLNITITYAPEGRYPFLSWT